MGDVPQASVSLGVRVYVKAEGSITVALVFLPLPPGPTIPAELLGTQQHIQKAVAGQSPEVWKPELWLTFQKGARSASPLKYSWLESLKLLPGVGKTDGQTNKKKIILIFADLVFHHLAREELAAVGNLPASSAVIVHPSKYLSS